MLGRAVEIAGGVKGQVSPGKISRRAREDVDRLARVRPSAARPCQRRYGNNQNRTKASVVHYLAAQGASASVAQYLASYAQYSAASGACPQDSQR